MAYLASKLISYAYYTAGLVSRGALQNVSAEQGADGLDLLNDLLAEKSNEANVIPYYTYYEFPTVANQESYTIPYLIDIDTITFNLGTVRFSLNPLTRNEYFATSRVDGVNSLPTTVRFERQPGGAKLYFYFVPSQVYPVKLWGKFALTNVTADTDLSLTYDRSYLVYLRHGLARYICNWNSISMPDDADKELKRLEEKLKFVDPPDMTIKMKSVLINQPGLNWANVNFPGWV